MIEPVVSLLLSVLVLLLFAVLWSIEVADWLQHRDIRSVNSLLAASMLLVASTTLLLFALQRMGIVSNDVRIWASYVMRGALLLAGSLLVSIRIKRP